MLIIEPTLPLLDTTLVLETSSILDAFREIFPTILEVSIATGIG